MRYYWLKLKRDFFKRHDIRIIEAMPNGKDYILFYLKLLCESVDHEGRLRFSDQIPYNTEMLAVITDTNRDTVEAAVKLFTELGMMELMDDGTVYMTECERMMGFETKWAEKKRDYRERQALLCTDNARTIEGQTEDNVLTMSDKSKSKRKSKIEEKENIREKELLAEFAEVWKEYPRKEGRQNAEKAYVKARRDGVDKQTILDGITRYKAKIKSEGTEERYVMQGSTWFNQRRWTDEYSQTTKKRNYEERETSYEGVYDND